MITRNSISEKLHNGLFIVNNEILKLLKPNINSVKTQERDTLFEFSLDIICIAGMDGFYKKISQSFVKTLGYTEQELLSQPISNFMVKEDVPRRNRALNELRKGNPVIDFKNRYLCKDGSIKWIEWRAVPIPNERLVYSIGRDVTITKENEIALQELIKYKTDSLQYALHLQEAICHDPESLKEIFPQSFIFNSAKDIISGDFCWFERQGDQALVAVADCTGHGVPGAILSVLGIGKLHEIHKSLRLTEPAQILNELHSSLSKALGKKNGLKNVSDGMDIGFMAIDLKKHTLEFAGANNKICIVRDGIITELKGDNQGLGSTHTNLPFSNKTFQLQKNDMVYAFSDGYKDQFGGINGKKFMYKQLKEMFISIADKTADEQKSVIANALKQWKGDLEQVDDILIAGIRI